MSQAPQSSRWLLQGAKILHLDPPQVLQQDLRIQNGVIQAIEPQLTPEKGEQVMDLRGAWIMPGLVCGHTHLYSALSCGMPMPAEAPQTFTQILERIWWRLDRALDLEGVRLSALVGGVSALRSGVTTIVDHHASPNAIQDSLLVLDRALGQLGVRRILCYEVTDRGGKERALAGIKAHEELLSQPLSRQDQGMRATMMGGHANFTLSDETLRRCVDFANQANIGLHIHVAEAEDDAQTTGENPILRMERLGALRPGSLLAHCVHTTKDDLKRVQDAGAWISHQPRSNMNNAVGYAPVSQFGSNTILGTDGIGADMFSELQTAWYQAQESGVPWSPDRWLQTLTQTAQFAGQTLGTTIGKLAPNAAADLLVLDPAPGPPLRDANLSTALIFRLSSQQIRHVMVQGNWRLWNRDPVGVDPLALNLEAEQVSEAIWERMRQL